MTDRDEVRADSGEAVDMTAAALEHARRTASLTKWGRDPLR